MFFRAVGVSMVSSDVFLSNSLLWILFCSGCVLMLSCLAHPYRHPKWWAQFSRTEQLSRSILVKRERPRSAEILTGISGIRQCGHKPMMYILGQVDTLLGGLKYFKICFGRAVLHCLPN